MKTLMFALMLLAGTGFLLSLTAHIVALLGMQLPGAVWLLHIGIFAVWIPVVALGKRNRNAPGNQTANELWQGIPRWLRTIAQFVAVYVVINFVLFIATTPGHHGKKAPGEAPPAVVRGFSGHWMLFYGVAFLKFYTEVRKGSELKSP